MSATDELREWAKRFDRAWFNGEGIITFSTFRPTAEDVSIREIVESIADRIDAEHKSKVDEAYENGKRDERADWLDETDGGYIKLPVDADGVPIHVGDRVENNERVVRIVLTDDSWEPSVYVEKLPNVLHEYFCHEVSHYQPDSWERIIGDAVKNGMYDHDNERIQQKLVERCKRLAGEA